MFYGGTTKRGKKIVLRLCKIIRNIRTMKKVKILNLRQQEKWEKKGEKSWKVEKSCINCAQLCKFSTLLV